MKRTLLKTVWYYEWKSLARQPSLYIGLIAFALLGVFSIWQGYGVMNRQLLAIDSLQRSYKQDEAAVLAKFSDTLTASGKRALATAGMPELINYQLPQNAVNCPSGLACLAIGMRDIAPYYDRVKTSVSFLNPPNGIIQNPLTRFIGNLDFSFLLVYLAPLLWITISYNLYAAEREQGTYTLLSIQGADPDHVIRYRLLFRWMLLIVLLLFLHVIAFYFALLVAPVAPIHALLWLGLSLGWAFFWFSVTFVVIKYSRSSLGSAVSLLGLWLCFLWILPATINAFIKVKYPVPLRADMASFERHESEEIWEMNPKLLVDSFHYHNPSYLSSFNPAKDTLSMSKRFFAAYYDLLERRLLNYRVKLNTRIDQRNAVAREYAPLAPPLFVQQLFNGLASTDKQTQQEFEREVSLFQRKWKAFLYNFQLFDRMLKPADFESFPTFTFHQKVNDAGIAIKVGCLWLLSIIILFIPIVKSCLRQNN